MNMIFNKKYVRVLLTTFGFHLRKGIKYGTRTLNLSFQPITTTFANPCYNPSTLVFLNDLWWGLGELSGSKLKRITKVYEVWKCFDYLKTKLGFLSLCCTWFLLKLGREFAKCGVVWCVLWDVWMSLEERGWLPFILKWGGYFGRLDVIKFAS